MSKPMTTKTLAQLRPTDKVKVQLHVRDQIWTVEARVLGVMPLRVEEGGVGILITPDNKCGTNGFGPQTCVLG